MPTLLVVQNPVTDLPFSQQNVGVTALTLVNNQIAMCQTSIGAVLVRLPLTPGVRTCCAVLDAQDNASVNNITIDGNGTLIDGAATVTIAATGQAAAFTYDGVQWRRLTERRTFDGSGRLLELAADNPASAPSGNFGSQNLETTGSLLVGPTPRATTGVIRLANAQVIRARNAADSADVALVSLDVSNVMRTAPAVGISSYLELGVLPASAGTLRFPNLASAMARNAANTDDLAVFAVDASDQLFLACDGATFTHQQTYCYIAPTTSGYLGAGVGGGVGFVLTWSLSGVQTFDSRNSITTDLARVEQYLLVSKTTSSSAGTPTNFTFLVNAGETWIVELDGNVGCSGVGGVAFGLDCPAGSSLEGIVFGALSGGTSYQGTAMLAPNTPYGGLSAVAGPAPRAASVRATVVVGGTGGSITVRLYSVTNTQTSTLYQRAKFSARRATGV